MKHSPITLDALRIIDAIDRCGNFSLAAIELHKVPSSISYSVGKLEDDLDTTIFDRSRRKLTLTPVGRILLDQGRQILIATEGLTSQVKLGTEDWEMDFKICVDSTLNMDPIYDLVKQIQQVQPRIEVRIQEEVLSGTWDALNADLCDIAIGAEGYPPNDIFDVHELGQLVFKFVVCPDHPLAMLPQPISPQEVLNHVTVIVYDTTRNLPARSSGLMPSRTKILVPTFPHKIALLLQGTGVGFLPLHLIQRELKTGHLKVLDINQPRPPQTISAAWRRTNKGKSLNWIVQRLKQMHFDSELGLIVSNES